MIDGVLLANPSQFNQELFDIEHIEVLKGPQGALYGRNAIGGAIIIRTREPGDEIDGRFKAGYDSGPGYKVRGSASAARSATRTPEVPGLGLLLRDRRLHQQHVPRRGGRSVQGHLRRALKLLWEPSEDLQRRLPLSYSKVDTQALYFNITESVNDTSLPVRVNNRGENERDLMSASLEARLRHGRRHAHLDHRLRHIEELLTGDQFNFLPIPESVLFQFFGADQAQHQWLDVEASARRCASRRRPRTGCAGSSARTHRDRPLHLHRQRVRPRHWRRAARQARRRCRCSRPAVHLPRRLAGQHGLGAVRRADLRHHRAVRGDPSPCATTATSARTRPRPRRSSFPLRSARPSAPSRARSARRPGTICSRRSRCASSRTTTWTIYGGYSRGFRSGGFNQTGVGVRPASPASTTCSTRKPRTPTRSA